jgi:putative membrane protein
MAMTIVRWILVAALLTAFLLLAVANWTPVPFKLPDGTMVNIRLPLLLAAAFVAGWLPTWLILVGTRMQNNRKLARVGAGRTAMPAAPQPAINPGTGA